jgi:hypothetical protein
MYKCSAKNTRTLGYRSIVVRHVRQKRKTGDSFNDVIIELEKIEKIPQLQRDLEFATPQSS